MNRAHGREMINHPWHQEIIFFPALIISSFPDPSDNNSTGANALLLLEERKNSHQISSRRSHGKQSTQTVRS